MLTKRIRGVSGSSFFDNKSGVDEVCDFTIGCCLLQLRQLLFPFITGGLTEIFVKEYVGTFQLTGVFENIILVREVSKLGNYCPWSVS